MDYSNEYMIAKLKNGSHDMFNHVYESYYDQLVRFSFGIVMSEESHDVVHDVMARLWKNRMLLNECMSLKAYLYAAVRNSSFNCLKHRGIVDRANRKMAELIATTDEADVLGCDMTDFLQPAIDSLPPAQRSILILRLQGYSHREIAQQLGISPRTVGNQITNAYNAIRERLGITLSIVISILILTNK